MKIRWMAKRSGAISEQRSGPFQTEQAAVKALVEMLENSIAAWRRMGKDPSRDEAALLRVRNGETDVVEGGVRWQVYEFTLI